MSQPKFITSPSYDALHSAAVMMVREIRTMGWIDAVVAPARGGLLFGVIASHKLNVPLIPVSYSSKSGAGDDKNHSNELPEMSGSINTILITDDIVDSGKTLKEMVRHYEDHGIKVLTAAFHFKESAVYHPSVYYWRIPEDSEFINYPYELS
jgi:hypoxanthine phosphoribosyltransferase